MNASRRTSVRLQVESLEERSVPTTATFDAAGVLRITGTEAAETVQMGYSGHHIAANGLALVDAVAVRAIVIDMRGGNDVVDLSGLRQGATVYAGSGNDTVYGSQGNDILFGQAGDDLIWGQDGNDTLYGGEGDDRLFGGNGYDHLLGQQGNDFMDDGNRRAAEYIDGGSGRDWNADVVAVNGTQMTDVQQRGASTCNLMAALSGLTHVGYDFTHWINYVGPTSAGIPQYDIAFWDRSQWNWTRVDFTGTLTWDDPGHLTIANRPAVEYESWPIFMQRAWIQFHGNKGTASAGVVLQALTARAPTVERFVDDASFGTIANALNRRQVVQIVTLEPVSGNQLVADHAYTVLGVTGTGANRKLLLRNPWGQDGCKPTGRPDDGLIVVRWNDLWANLNYLAIL